MTKRPRKKRYFVDLYKHHEGFWMSYREMEYGEYWRAYHPDTWLLLAEAINWFPSDQHREGYGERREALMSKFVKKALATMKANKGVLKGPPDKWLEELPALREFLTLRKGDEGGERTPCSLTLSGDAETFKGCLREVDEGLMLWATAGSLQGVLEALDAQLQSENPDWRYDRFAKGNRKKK